VSIDLIQRSIAIEIETPELKALLEKSIAPIINMLRRDSAGIQH